MMTRYLTLCKWCSFSDGILRLKHDSTGNNISIYIFMEHVTTSHTQLMNIYYILQYTICQIKLYFFSFDSVFEFLYITIGLA